MVPSCASQLPSAPTSAIPTTPTRSPSGWVGAMSATWSGRWPPARRPLPVARATIKGNALKADVVLSMPKAQDVPQSWLDALGPEATGGDSRAAAPDHERDDGPSLRPDRLASGRPPAATILRTGSSGASRSTPPISVDSGARLQVPGGLGEPLLGTYAGLQVIYATVCVDQEGRRVSAVCAFAHVEQCVRGGDLNHSVTHVLTCGSNGPPPSPIRSRRRAAVGPFACSCLEH